MKINKDYILNKANESCKGNLMETLSIKFIDVGEDFITAKMPVDKKIHQPDGVLHGGATVALAETVGSFAAHMYLDTEKYFVRGIDISAQHVKSVKSGFVFATAKCIHRGRTTQIFNINVVNENNEFISLCKLTTITLPK
tara:strand:- start:276 stop:695 length:420 start_codon:yes stop_codon:yes gene_type:complete